MSKLKKEIGSNIKDLKKLSYDDFKNCVYLEAVVMESLRMYSTANGLFPRVAKEDHYLKID
jgi:cytochrome P450